MPNELQSRREIIFYFDYGYFILNNLNGISNKKVKILTALEFKILNFGIMFRNVLEY
jgi:hypothetical protein